MGVLDKLLKIAGKEDFQIDSSIGTGYIIRQCWKYGWMMIRGKVFSLGNRQIANSIFVGKNVKVIEKKYLTIGEKTKLQDGVYIDALSRTGVQIGKNVVIGRNTRIECTGGLQSIGKGVKMWYAEILYMQIIKYHYDISSWIIRFMMQLRLVSTRLFLLSARILRENLKKLLVIELPVFAASIM